MIFVYKKWDEFCRQLKEKGIISIPACEVKKESKTYLVLKHDIETAVPKAFVMAKIEKRYGHRGSYYVHEYLLNSSKNVELLLKIQEMGHEVSYHYDVMDSNHGNIDDALKEFSKNIKRFENIGFDIKTVCQHGNPVVERVGYTSNRDFFRNKSVQELYSEIADIMVNYKQKYHIDYTYYSDAGRKFNMIYDPINNDIVNSDNKNTPYENLHQLVQCIDDRSIVSTHPHRWTNSVVIYLAKEKLFLILKTSAKLLIKIPTLKKIMSKYYYLAKKI